MANRKRVVLLSILLFNGVTAVAGGIGLMTGAVAPPPSYLQHAGFVRFYFPGVILMAIVGGSALLAALCVVKRVNGAFTSLVAGVIMLAWIVGEIVSIRYFDWLQAVYLVTGAAVLWLAPRGGMQEGDRL